MHRPVDGGAADRRAHQLAQQPAQGRLAARHAQRLLQLLRQRQAVDGPAGSTNLTAIMGCYVQHNAISAAQ